MCHGLETLGTLCVSQCLKHVSIHTKHTVYGRFDVVHRIPKTINILSIFEQINALLVSIRDFKH